MLGEYGLGVKEIDESDIVNRSLPAYCDSSRVSMAYSKSKSEAYLKLREGRQA